MDCDFENGWCGWRLESSIDDFQFRVLTGEQVVSDPTLVGPWEDKDGSKTGHFVVAGWKECPDCNDFSTILGPTLHGPVEEVTSLCLKFDFIFQRLDKVEVFTASQDTEPEVLWRLTKEDRHSVPENAWMPGQLLLKKNDTIKDGPYWVRDNSTKHFITVEKWSF